MEIHVFFFFRPRAAAAFRSPIEPDSSEKRTRRRGSNDLVGRVRCVASRRVRAPRATNGRTRAGETRERTTSALKSNERTARRTFVLIVRESHGQALTNCTCSQMFVWPYIHWSLTFPASSFHLLPPLQLSCAVARSREHTYALHAQYRPLAASLA